MVRSIGLEALASQPAGVSSLQKASPLARAAGSSELGNRPQWGWLGLKQL
jgi:hypothetical protein